MIEKGGGRADLLRLLEKYRKKRVQINQIK